MKNFKCIICFLIILLFCLSPIFSLSIQDKKLFDPFDSQEELEKFEKVDLLSKNSTDFLNNTTIYLISISEGEELYSWFGHSAILVESPIANLIYDYGVFNFNSKNFYFNFIQGKMYYKLLLSEKNFRLEVAKQEDRTVKEIKIDFSNKEKASIINFLNYNSKDENKVYLYHFFNDNCATRIRDVFDWSTNGEFKKWASNTESDGTFRQLSSKVLEHNLLVYWILNSFLGQPSDKMNTAWEDMFLPYYLEKNITEFNKFNTQEKVFYQRQSEKLFSISESYDSKILTFSIFAFILSLIAFILKRHKQIRNLRYYGVYSTFISLFFFLISLCILFLSIFSFIDPAWYNENLIFLNPISTGLLTFFSIKLINKKNPIKNLINYERICRYYSHSIIILIFLKLFFKETFYQNNWNIFIPILIFYLIQGFIFRTHKN